MGTDEDWEAAIDDYKNLKVRNIEHLFDEDNTANEFYGVDDLEESVYGYDKDDLDDTPFKK